MKIEVFYDKDNKKSNVKLKDNSKVEDLLRKLNINPEIVIVSRKDIIILNDEKLKDNDTIKLFSVISGG